MASFRNRMLKPRTDPWSDPPPLESGLRRDPEKVLRFWEWEWQRLHFCEWFKTAGPPGVGKACWERTKSCRPLLDLCNTHPAKKLHPVFQLLERIVRDSFEKKEKEGGPPRRIRPDREAASLTGRVQRIIEELARLPAWRLFPDERKWILNLLKRGEDREPVDSVFIHITLGDDLQEKAIISLPPPSSPGKRGRPPKEKHEAMTGADYRNGRICLLAERVRDLLGGGLPWDLVATLLRHFDPEGFPQSFKAQNAAARVRGFRSTHKAHLDDLRKDLENDVKSRLRIPTGIV